mmetsp:Transcript_52535/g.119555  ORF Transcript_52535/g.119555 Transcript_52535/m.119555 type:complete len:152 (+) Transcript_52535:50-505(+)|eukprot:CAMPEP_0204314002 /NCGR_PEP_ID=MMETSP0469-20131031/3954_1 /ASSEMBLY_ACC=CAM_ASM_000384 /TAXON_ID=2969 /ORGANISM="Oxyrrhis marina" /LENGTH=151 /DNA_ID=CAMNT_0051294419 /DNA_START=42 /DNA_END=497 /DNA_ORIENTATION=-
MASKPNVLWAQRKDSVLVTVELTNVADMKISLEERKLEFSGASDGIDYAFSLALFGPIDTSGSKYSTKRLVEIFLKKKGEESWDKLAEGKNPFVKCDWSKWADSDDEDEKPGFDTASMGAIDTGESTETDLPDVDSDVSLDDLDEPLDIED